MIGTPVIMFTHSQGGGFGFDITEARPKLVQAMVTVEPGGPQFGGADTAKVTAGTAQPEFVGADQQPVRVRPAGERAGRPQGRARREVRSGPTKCAAGCRSSRRASWRGGRTSRCSAISANGTYHRVYDPCIPKFLNQAGVKADFVRLEDVGIRGNSHMMMLEKNSDDIIEFVVGWIKRQCAGRQ